MPTRRMLTIGAIVIVALAVVLVALGPTVFSQPNQPAGHPAASAGSAEDAAAQAAADLAGRLGIDASAITVASTTAHTWTDTSLGLPKPGMIYAQVETSGHIVTLSYDDKVYVYHVAGDTVALKPGEAAPAAEAGEANEQALAAVEPADLEEEMDTATPANEEEAAIAQAREALAAHVGAPVEDLALVSVEEHTWSDTSLGLPEPGMLYAQVLTDGYIVTLSYGDQDYVYHVAGGTVKLNEAGN